MYNYIGMHIERSTTIPSFFIKILFVQKFENLERFSAQEAAEELHFTKVRKLKERSFLGKSCQKTIVLEEPNKGWCIDATEFTKMR